MTRAAPEYALHVAVADYLHAVLHGSVVWSTIGHGGGGAIRGAKLQRAGLRAGIADIMICWWSYLLERPETLWIELKAKKGKWSEAQENFARDVEKIDHRYFVCHSIEEVERVLKRQEVPTKGRIAT